MHVRLAEFAFLVPDCLKIFLPVSSQSQTLMNTNLLLSMLNVFIRAKDKTLLTTHKRGSFFISTLTIFGR